MKGQSLFPVIALIVLTGGCGTRWGCSSEKTEDQPPLAKALQEGRIDVIESLIREGADPNAPMDLRLSLTDLAENADSSHWPKIALKFLQLQNAWLYEFGPGLCAGWQEKLKDSAAQLLNKLWQKPSLVLDPEVSGAITGVTPMHLAAMFCHRPLALALLDRGADVNARDGVGLSPLHHVSCGEIATWLLEHGADPKAKSDSGLTPLHLALERPIVQALLKAGADIEARDRCGNTPLHIASAFGFNFPPPGAGSVRPTQHPALAASSQKLDQEIESIIEESWLLRLLLKVAVHLKDSMTQLLEDVNVGQALIEHGADTTVTNDAGLTPAALQALLESRRRRWDD
jgi:hypothetical protein